MTLSLESLSIIAVYSAMAVYTVAFILFAMDLARRSAPAPAAASVGAQSAAASGGSTAVLEKADAPAKPAKGPRYLRAAMAIMTLAWLLHVAGTVMRGIAAERVPWANMYEFSLTATAIIVGVFLAVQVWQDLRFLGVFVSGLALIWLGIASVNFYVAIVPLAPSLQSVWLVVHVFVATLGTGFFALGAGLSIVQLIQTRRAAGAASGLSFMRTLPGADALENLAYRVNIVGFVFWSFTLMAGAIWAERAWGRYWGWDTKEVWTFVIWVVFAGYIHARATRGWRGSRSAWLAIIGFAAVIFNFVVVNLFFKGLHAYSGLPTS